MHLFALTQNNIFGLQATLCGTKFYVSDGKMEIVEPVTYSADLHGGNL